MNASQQAKGSIHNDEVATKLGFRGGTVAGSIHLELFPPLLVEAFGPRWLCVVLSMDPSSLCGPRTILRPIGQFHKGQTQERDGHPSMP